MEDTQASDQAVVTPTTDEVHPAIGLADGALLNGEKIVYEYDDAGEVVGWHKERLTLLQMAELGDAAAAAQAATESATLESEAVNG